VSTAKEITEDTNTINSSSSNNNNNNNILLLKLSTRTRTLIVVMISRTNPRFHLCIRLLMVVIDLGLVAAVQEGKEEACLLWQGDSCLDILFFREGSRCHFNQVSRHHSKEESHRWLTHPLQIL
jgi:hypothetical protein